MFSSASADDDASLGGQHHGLGRIGDAIETVQAGIWLVLLVFLVACGPG